MADQNQIQKGTQGAKPQGNPSGQKQPAIAKAPYQKPIAYVKDENPNFRGIVRVVGKDLDGHFTVYKALLRVKGIGHSLAITLAKIVLRELKLNKKSRVGDLSEEQMDRLDNIIKNPQLHGIKNYMLNRQKDRETGKNTHLLMNDLGFAVKQDIQLEKETKSYKGWRFTMGQRVRGQHNRTTGRSGFTVGVMKKQIKDQKSAAAAGGDKGKPAEKKK
ncbi:30S ribosomal protein S13 [Candidatus Micrarchaeota archaeon]|nr:30S ribosomal protein S13 [Candidatus Micrarchaeota archaeon]